MNAGRVLSSLLVVAAGAHSASAEPLRVPAGWISEDAGLARALPAVAEHFAEEWRVKDGVVFHGYQLHLARGTVAPLVAALVERGGKGGDSRGILSIEGPMFRLWGQESVDYQHWFPSRRALADVVSATPLLAPFLPLLDTLGEPQEIRIGRTAGAPADAKLVFPHRKKTAAAAGRWLAANGFRGNWAQGWVRKLPRGARALADRDKIDDRDVVVLMVVDEQATP